MLCCTKTVLCCTKKHVYKHFVLSTNTLCCLQDFLFSTETLWYLYIMVHNDCLCTTVVIWNCSIIKAFLTKFYSVQFLLKNIACHRLNTAGRVVQHWELLQEKDSSHLHCKQKCSERKEKMFCIMRRTQITYDLKGIVKGGAESAINLKMFK